MDDVRPEQKGDRVYEGYYAFAGGVNRDEVAFDTATQAASLTTATQDEICKKGFQIKSASP
jgi:hypothetical protein